MALVPSLPLPSLFPFQYYPDNLDMMKYNTYFRNMDKFYTAREIRELLRISKSTLYRMVLKRQLSPIKAGGKTFFPESEVNRFIEKLNEKK
jgi:excisionase family DNA binding protein